MSEKLINHWIETSDRDFDTMLWLLKGKKYSQSLFFGHLTLEKLIKAMFAKTNTENPYAPKSHNLLYLAKLSNIELDEKTEDKLEYITDFNMTARYEDEKQAFYKKCTEEFTIEQIKIIKELREWLKKLIAEFSESSTNT